MFFQIIIVDKINELLIFENKKSYSLEMNRIFQIDKMMLFFYRTSIYTN